MTDHAPTPFDDALADLARATSELRELEAKFATLERLIESMAFAVPREYLAPDERDALNWILGVGTWR
jgi:hypothetical protein